MAIEERVHSRIEALLQQASHLRQGSEFGQVRSEDHRQQCAGWLASASNIIHLMCPRPTDAYRVQFERIMAKGVHLCAHDLVGEGAAVLSALLNDAREGLLLSIADHARAETFDDFLDHADEYLKQSRMKEAGVIAGVVFEDSVRRICRSRNITEKNVQLDQLITELANVGVLTGGKAKRARASAHVRTKATHAQWDEFDLNDVRACIDFTRELVANELDA